jgi:peptidoglycan/xylan/chitin deacetylase (PgdA/CDA1 family)
MKGRRQRVAEAAVRLGITRALRPLHDRGRPSLLVLAWHRIVPLTAGDYPLDLDLISATPEEFDWQMGFLREHMSPVSLTQVIEHLQTGTPLPQRPVAVTFDDGFSDTWEHAFPALRRHRIPATVFVTTGYVDSRKPFWFELAAHLMMKIAPRAIAVSGNGVTHLPLGPGTAQRRHSIRLLHAFLKSLSDERRETLMAAWSEQFAADIDAAACDSSRPLTWAQIVQLASAGVEIGSHTVTHPNLAQTTDEALAWELSESRRAIAERLHSEPQVVAYPFGTRGTFDDRVMRAAERAGYQLGVAYTQGCNWLHSLHRFELRRVDVALSTSRLHFESLTMLPDWVAQ